TVYIAFFFFQAEDGIRDFHVTGVQTCALPILCQLARPLDQRPPTLASSGSRRVLSAPSSTKCCRSKFACRSLGLSIVRSAPPTRSEERRVGKECAYRWGRGCVDERER